mmetsp:Transcript_4326/g.5333  ORF Transcript_4326/g.5333 Transcript_4326/m.5333 type:complete len:82 (-) Transcript_4326:643-888(-)
MHVRRFPDFMQYNKISEAMTGCVFSVLKPIAQELEVIQHITVKQGLVCCKDCMVYVDRPVFTLGKQIFMVRFVSYGLPVVR